MAQKKATVRKKSTSSTSKSSSRSAAASKKPIRREVGALICFFLAVFGTLGYFKIDAVFINFFSKFLGGMAGWGFYVYPPMLFVSSYILATHRGRPVRLRLVCALLMPIALGSLLFLIFNNTNYSWSWKLFSEFWTEGANLGNAGVLSGLLAMTFKYIFSKAGAIIVYLVLTLFLTMMAFNLTVSKVVEYFRGREKPQYDPPEPEPSREERLEARRQKLERRRVRNIDIPVDDPDELKNKNLDKREEKLSSKSNEQPKTDDNTNGTIPFVFGEPVELEHKNASADKLISAAKSNNNINVTEKTVDNNTGHTVGNGDIKDESIVETERVIPAMTNIMPPLTKTEPTAAENRAEVNRAAEEIGEQIEGEKDRHTYKRPPIDLLLKPTGGAVDGTNELSINSRRLNDALKSFSIDAHIVNYTRGPTVTRYEVELEQGVKLTKLTSLSNDIALSLGAASVRIAPIPNKISVVGIEVPNKLVSTVYIREVIESSNFKNHKSKLAFALGKDIAGSCIVGDISKLPHLLIAGTTGSGKSVCMNSLIISLLYNASPDEVRLIMIDPKMIELGGYNGIPHLLIPVVTDPKKAAGALQWAVNEMMKRYRLFAEVGVKDMEAYNDVARKDAEREPMYRIVIVIDELADLMLVAAKEVEEYICRIAQMARAAGMHLVIATQRPSANVITGIMKANIPSRIAFAVASQMESRIILDTGGAEKLVGKGDMLYFPLGAGKPMRVQGTMITSEEVEAVCKYIKEGASSDYKDDIIQQIENHGLEKEQSNGSGKSEKVDSDADELLTAAIEVVMDTGQASVSMLQRRLKLGYSRAARIVDQMEERGIVGPFEGSKPRQLLINKEQWQQMQMGGDEMGQQLPDTATGDDNTGAE